MNAYLFTLKDILVFKMHTAYTVTTEQQQKIINVIRKAGSTSSDVTARKLANGKKYRSDESKKGRFQTYKILFYFFKEKIKEESKIQALR